MRSSEESAPPVAQKGMMEDVIDIFANPRALFDRTRNSSAVRPAVIQMLVLGILGIALHNLMAPYFDAEFARATAQQAEAAAKAGTEMPAGAAAMGEKIATFTAYAGGFIGPWFVALLGGLAVFIGARIVGVKLRFGQGMMIASWSYMPAIIGTVATAVQGALLSDPMTVRGVTDASLGPARFLDPATASPVLLAVAQSVDLIAIWTLVLSAIGVSVVGRVSLATGAIATVARFALVLLLTVVPALLRG